LKDAEGRRYSLYRSVGSPCLAFLGHPRLGRLSPVCDAGKGVFDRQLVDDVGIVFVGPFLGFGVARDGSDDGGGDGGDGVPAPRISRAERKGERGPARRRGRDDDFERER
jgi:hypothetical protein